MKLNYSTLAIVFLLAGCTADLNTESVKSYNNRSLNEFIKDRFTINNSLNHTIHNGLDILASSNHNLYWYYSRSKPLPDGSYVFFAPFNGPEMLERPKNDLSVFCKSSKGGKLIASTYFNQDILSSYETNPIQAYIASVQELSQVRMSVSAGSLTASRPLTDGEINAIALGESTRVANTNRYSDIAFAKKDYFTAVKNGSFGTFNCSDNTNKRILWSIFYYTNRLRTIR